MDLELIRSDLKVRLKDSRYLHSIGVEEVCHDLAFLHGFNTNKAITAGLLHDCAKYLTDQELLEECEKNDLPVREVERHCPFLLHAKLGAFLARTRYGIQDEDILSAITYHTTGRPAMTMLEKIVFTADYIEPSRKPLPRVSEIRKTALTNMDLAVYMTAENVLNYLKSQGSEIDTLTVDTLEYYKRLLRT